MRMTTTMRSTVMTALFLAILVLPAQMLRAEVKLPSVFSDHMVLQSGKPVAVWGWADANEKVTVRFRDNTRTASANAQGEWRVDLPAMQMQTGKPSELTVAASNTITFQDVLVGEVWLCSGQSNMEMGIAACLNQEEEIAAANYPNIRLFMVPNKISGLPLEDVEASWKICTPENIKAGGWAGFSGAAYFFGREIHKELGVPVGLIDTTWGGTRIEPWTPPEGFAGNPILADIRQRALLLDPRSDVHKKRLRESLAQSRAWLKASNEALNNESLLEAPPAFPGELLPPGGPHVPTALYNAMIHPLAPYSLRGFLWYQGESNSGEGMLYAEKMKALIGGWREIWNQDDLPFYFVQIAPWDYGPARIRVLPEFWEAQAAVPNIVPNTGMIVIHDVGDLKDIHPKNKQEVGRRLALQALAKTYGQTDLVCDGPAYNSMEIKGNTIRIAFDHVAEGLAARDGKPLNWFEIIDKEEGGFVEANARIEGAEVVLSADGVPQPVAVRYGWHMLAEPNLMNIEGLPAAPFRAGDVPKRDMLGKNVPEAKDYTLVYDLDIAKAARPIVYDVDDSKTITKPFDRIAYFLELQKDAGEIQYVYVSMDAFTDDISKIGVPTVSPATVFQINVANMNVVSNVSGVPTSDGSQGGNIEFWPHNYGGNNNMSIPNATGVWDFGDSYGDPVAGYGSMQVHDHDAKMTLMALNNWASGAGADLGIGNSPEGNPDWTFAKNAGSYSIKRLRVLVRLK